MFVSHWRVGGLRRRIQEESRGFFFIIHLEPNQQRCVFMFTVILLLFIKHLYIKDDVLSLRLCFTALNTSAPWKTYAYEHSQDVLTIESQACSLISLNEWRQTGFFWKLYLLQPSNRPECISNTSLYFYSGSITNVYSIFNSILEFSLKQQCNILGAS